MGGERELEIFFESVKTTAEALPVLFARFDEIGQSLQLDATDRGLGVERFQVVAEMTVNVFVVVAFGELAELPLESFATSIVFARGTPAIATPVAETFCVRFQGSTTDDVDRTTLAHRQVVRRVERLGGDIPEAASGSGEVELRSVLGL